MSLHDQFFREYFANNLLVIDLFVVTALETDASRLKVLADRWQVSKAGRHQKKLDKAGATQYMVDEHAQNENESEATHPQKRSPCIAA